MAASAKPLVSVLMTCKNSEEFIAESLDSALGQTHEEIEILVSDNASTDGTAEILRDYERREPERVRVRYGDEDIGPTASRNKAYEMARGELIAWLDSDDIWLPAKTEREVAVMLERPEVGLVHSGAENFDSDTGEVVPGGLATARSGDLMVPLYMEGCFVMALTALFRRRALDERGLTLRDSEWVYGDDYHAWLVISLDWQTAGIDEVLARYRMHGQNLSFAQGNHFLNRIALLREFTDEYPEARERLGRDRRTGLGRHYLSAARFEREHGSRPRAAGYRLHGFALAPGTAAARVWRRTIMWGGRVLRRLGLRRP